MLKWELARYLMDSKKVIDRLMFISENIENLRKVRDLLCKNKDCL